MTPPRSCRVQNLYLATVFLFALVVMIRFLPRCMKGTQSTHHARRIVLDSFFVRMHCDLFVFAWPHAALCGLYL